MKILFFVEPLIEMGRPYWKEGWANLVVRELIETLQKSSLKFEFYMGFNEPISQKFRAMNDVEEFIFTQEELLPFDDRDYLDVSISWYKGTYTEEQLDYYVRLLKTKFQSFIPDVIFTFTPIPYLEKAFPTALILHTEFSMFSREPYPVSFHLDPCGMFHDAFIIKFKNELLKYRIDEQQLRRLELFKDKARKLITKKCPFRVFMLIQKRKFDYLLLLPLQFSGYYAFDGLCKFKSQYEFLTYVFDKVPQNVGIVVTTHPEYDILDNDTIQYLTSKYPNFIYHEEFRNYTAVSQYLIAYVDAVITVSSSVGLQTLWWDKKLLVLGSSHLDVIADSNTLDNLMEVLIHPQTDKNAIAYWMITRYAITANYIFDPTWLTNFICLMVTRYRSHEITFDYYQLMDNEETLFNVLMNSLNTNIPRPSKKKSEGLECFYEYQINITKFFKQINCKKVIVFGTGVTSQKVCEYIPLKIDYFVDNNPQKWGNDFLGLKVNNPGQLLKEEKSSLAIIIASQYYDDISEQLIEMGFQENIHFWNGLTFYL